MEKMLNLLRTCLIYGEHAQFMEDMLNFRWTYSIYGIHAQFLLNLWWTCSFYGKHAQFLVNMLNLWWTCSIYGEHAQFIVSMLNLWWTCSIGLFECPNQSSALKDTVILIFKSADLYSHSWLDVTIRLALKNYPKMTLWMSKSIKWIKRYINIDL